MQEMSGRLRMIMKIWDLKDSVVMDISPLRGEILQRHANLLKRILGLGQT